MNHEKPKKSALFILPLLLILVVAVAYLLTNKYLAPSAYKQIQPVVQELKAKPVTNPQNEVNVTIETRNFSFTPNIISAKVGDKVVIELKNVEGFHDLKIDEFNVSTKMLEAGNSDTIEFTADKAGVYEFHCSVGEHRKMGMVGTLTVE